MANCRFLFWRLSLLALRKWNVMKVGDLVKCGHLTGLIVGKQLLPFGPVYRVFVKARIIFLGLHNMELLNESR